MSRGFSLVEVLVAVLVLSLGLLGAAALLLGGLRDQSQALRHGAALAVLADMADRVRANASAGPAYDTRSSPSGEIECNAVTPCNAENLARFDRAHFATAARTQLPYQSPRESILFEPATGSTAPARYRISLQWRDGREPDATDEATLVVLAQPVAGAS
jgi:type IV pilus assembly protein PilV